MALVVFGEKIDFTSIDLPQEGGYVIGFDINTGLLSQMDYLGNVEVVGSNGGGPLSNTLSLGNNTGTNSIVLDSSIVKGTNKFSLSDVISLTTDNGGYNESYLYMNSGNVILGNGSSKSFRIESTGITTKWSDTNKQVINSNAYQLTLNNLSQLQFGKTASDAGAKLPSLISTDNSTIGNGLINTVVIGGQNISASQSNSVYVPYLYIQDGKVIRGTKGTGQIRFTDTNDVISSNSNFVIGLVSSTSSVSFRQNGIFVKDSATASSTPNYDSNIIYVGTKNSSATAGIKNSVVVGGLGLVATQDNTVYLGNNVNINNAYTLPSTDGTYNQILTTDGSGNLSWGGGSQVGGLGATNSIPRWTSTSTLGTSSITDNGSIVTIKNSLLIDSFGIYTSTPGTNNLKFGYKALKSITIGNDNIGIGYNSLRTNYNNHKNIAIGNYTLENYSTGISTFTILTPGSGYIDGDYLNIPLKYISGSTFSIAPLVEIIVSGGIVTDLTLKTPGSGFIDNTTILGVDNSYIGGTGSGFQLTIDLLTQGGDGIDGVIAIGYNALNLQQNNENSANMAIGYEAMRNSTSGYLNTAIGYQSMYSNTYGGSNTSVGFKSLYSNIDGHNNVAVGLWSMYSNTYGGENTAVGMESLGSNTTGYANTSIGFESMYSNTLGSYNTALGDSSLGNNTTTISSFGTFSGGMNYSPGVYSLVTLVYATGSTIHGYNYPIVNIVVGVGGTVSSVTLISGGSGLQDSTTIFTVDGVNNLTSTPGSGTGSGFFINISSLSSGNNNTAIGYYSLVGNTTGSDNTAVGHQSLLWNTIGLVNTAVGHTSLYNNTAGSDNVALGVETLFNNTIGSVNLAIGNSSLYNNVIGDDNTAIGHESMYSNLSGYENVSVGELSLSSNISGYGNTVLGFNSLGINTIGYNNTAIGHQSGPNYTGATNSKNSIYIGHQAGYYSHGYDNEIIIGNTMSYGTNSVVLGNTSTAKTILSGSVLIGTTSSVSSAILKIDSTTQGVLVPRMTRTQITSISAPSEGLIVYNTDIHQLCFYNGSSWRVLTDTAM